MGRLCITLVDQIRFTKTRYELPDDIPVDKLLPALVARLNLSSEGAGGDPGFYRLKHSLTDRCLEGGDTLASVGVAQHDILVLFAVPPEDDHNATRSIDAIDPPLAVVRELMTAAFTPEDLCRFCQERKFLQPLTANFGPKYNMNEMVDEVIKFCRTRHLWKEFLDEVEQQRPRQYFRFASRLEVR